MKKIAIVGAGGFGQEVACIIKNINKIKTQWHFIGFFDDATHLQNTSNHYGKVIGPISDLNKIQEPLAIAIGIGNTKTIQNIVTKIANPNIYFPNFVHPTVLFLDEETLKIGKGNIFSANCVVSCNVEIGNFNIFNTRVTLGHDDNVGNYNVFNPNVQISGSVKIGNLNLFGFNSGVIQGKKIGDQNTIGAGAMLLRNIREEGTYIGNPAIKVNF